MHLPGRTRSSALAAGLLAVSLAASACAPGVPTSTPQPAGPLLTVQTRGGECPGGPCGTTVVLERDGRVHQAAKPPNDLGTVWPEALASLDAAIAAADFEEIRSHPFSGECPTAYDGQEIVFEFGAPGGVERIATCEVAVDFGSPLFVAVATALGPFVALPTR
ncbi:MAG: hypothetical protein H6Q36_1337 [Chloroflexi bacterium]|nr:hypothetical protein [Chloroflexota bacterium]